MKNFNIKFKWTLAVCASALLLMIPSCSLDEDVYSIYTPETFYSNDYQVLSSLSGVYRGFATIPTFGAPYRVQELTTDQVITHGKIQGWWHNSSFEQLQIHTWDASHSYINGFWNVFGIPCFKQSDGPMHLLFLWRIQDWRPLQEPSPN